MRDCGIWLYYGGIEGQEPPPGYGHDWYKEAAMLPHGVGAGLYMNCLRHESREEAFLITVLEDAAVIEFEH